MRKRVKFLIVETAWGMPIFLIGGLILLQIFSIRGELSTEFSFVSFVFWNIVVGFFGCFLAARSFLFFSQYRINPRPTAGIAFFSIWPITIGINILFLYLVGFPIHNTAFVGSIIIGLFMSAAMGGSGGEIIKKENL